MLHLGMLFHDLRMLAIFGNCREDEFMILLAIVLQDETDLFAPAHFNARGLITHLPASLEHLDVDDARGLLRITWLAGRETSVTFMRGRLPRHCDGRHQDCCGRRQQEADGNDEAGNFRHGVFLQCSLWLLPGLIAFGPALGWAGGPLWRGDDADELATSYATVPCGCL